MTDDVGGDTIELSAEETLDLFLLLREHEAELGPGLIGLLSRTERYLYRRMSIDELERTVSGHGARRTKI